MKNTHSFFTLFLLIALVSCGSDDDPAIVADTQSPTTPLNLIVSGSTNNSWNISWEASSDNEAVMGYNVYMGGSLIQNNIPETTTMVTDLISNSRYSIYVTATDDSGNESELSNTITCTFVGLAEFKTTLSEMGVYTSYLGSLIPAEGVQLYELNSTLFTDYAKKQRLIRLPNCNKMEYNNSDLLPKFPDNTLIAKTFYYNLDETNPGSGNKIIETRILIKVNGTWIPGNYVWNEAQTEATYRETGSIENINYTDINGTARNINICYT